MKNLSLIMNEQMNVNNTAINFMYHIFGINKSRANPCTISYRDTTAVHSGLIAERILSSISVNLCSKPLNSENFETRLVLGFQSALFKVISKSHDNFAPYQGILKFMLLRNSV